MVSGVGGERTATCIIIRNVWNDLDFHGVGSAWGGGGRLQNHTKYMVTFILLVHVLYLPPTTWGGKGRERWRETRSKH